MESMTMLERKLIIKWLKLRGFSGEDITDFFDFTADPKNA